MRVSSDGPTYIYRDTMSMTHNTSKPESMIKEKSNSIYCNTVREVVAMGECATTHVLTLQNLVDSLTKVLYQSKRRNFVNGLLCDIYEYDLN